MLFGCIACSERKVYTAENDQRRYFVQTSFLKSHFFLCKLLLDFATSSVNYFFFKFVESFRGLFHHSGKCILYLALDWTTTTSDQRHPLNIRKQEPYKYFKFFNIEKYPWYTHQLLQFIQPATWLQLPNKNNLKGEG